jgi:F0F1-type ATP synthase assembly protein I
MSRFKPEDAAGLGMAVQLALTFALPLVVAIFLGQYLGSRFGNEPLFIIGSVLLGLFVGFRQALRLLLKK